MSDYIAHRRKDGTEQSLLDHLEQVGALASQLASKIGVADAGELIGLLHDFGKFSKSFQRYLKSATGIVNPDEDEYVDFKGLKGKIDHSSAGAQWIWEHCKNQNAPVQLVGQILALCIASHHSGLIDCLNADGEKVFIKRMNKPDDKTHQKECLSRVATSFLHKLDELAEKNRLKAIFDQLQKISATDEGNLPGQIGWFNWGMFTRLLFSCLIDADRINSADFEYPDNAFHRNNKPADWMTAISRLEAAIAEFDGDKPIDEMRRTISNFCKDRAVDAPGIYTLTVPTGGGKTFSSLRYALHHAHQNRLDRIIYIIPYTSIIEQNAQAIRELLECSDDEFPWVLEQHSNLEPELQTWHSKLVSENWDAPIVMTTMVQFLEVLFSGGTRGVRKMHQLTRSVLVFDEIQTLPVNCTHLFCNALNYLTRYCKTTAVLCTATQPLLDDLKTPEKGQLKIPPENEIAPDVKKLFEDLRRVNVSNKCTSMGWVDTDIADLALKEFLALGSCLVIVNTKTWAQQLYQLLLQNDEVDHDVIFQLSTNLCPAHRKVIFNDIRTRLSNGQPVLCVSTQLIEAGVDVDFASVIRFLAGLDSIAQAAGRCNRNGLRETATVHVLNPDHEPINRLLDIRVGRDKARRVLDEDFDDLLAPDAMRQYFKYYFYDRASDMSYPVKDKKVGLDDNVLNMLSNNRNIGNTDNHHLLKQSFMTAGKAFKAIDSPTQSVIVPYTSDGERIITELCGVAKEFEARKYRTLLKQAQIYSVNVFPNFWEKLQTEKAVHEIQPGEGIYHVDKTYYSNEFGLCDYRCNQMDFMSV